jgi:regulator of sirC expression with transglutaminase-like and TPR domain
VDDLRRFGTMFERAEPPLDETLAIIAAHGRPEVEVDAVLRRLDQMAELTSVRDAGSLCAELFGPGGLRGDTENYHDPRNSLIDQVLERRLGIPITLSVVGIEVGRRVGVGLVGVGMPGHFILRDGSDPTRFFDPFRGGAPLDRPACRALFERLHGRLARFDESFLDPTPAVSIVARVLANLHHAHVRLGDRPGLVRVTRLQSRLPTAGLDEQRALAELLAADGRFDEAADVHEQLSDTDRAASEEHAHRAIRLRARMN